MSFLRSAWDKTNRTMEALLCCFGPQVHLIEENDNVVYAEGRWWTSEEYLLKINEVGQTGLVHFIA